VENDIEQRLGHLDPALVIDKAEPAETEVLILRPGNVPTNPTLYHPERSLVRIARQTESKDSRLLLWHPS